MADAVVMLAQAAPSRELALTLGDERAARLRRVLADRAGRWAQDAFGSDAVTLLPEAGPEAGPRTGAEAEAGADTGADTGADANRAQAAASDLRSGLAAALAAHTTPRGWPVIAVAPELPVWRPDLAAAALEDLHDGCALSVGPIFDGGFYLLGLARPLPGLLDLAAAELPGHDALGALVALAEREQLEVGLLRTERGLRRAADVRALLADPLTDGELRGLLG